MGQGKFNDLTGQRFGRIVVESYAGLMDRKGRTNRHSAWNCRCDCGTTKLFFGTDLIAGTRSCGCLRNDRVRAANVTHGMTDSPTYLTWVNMLQRCNNPKTIKYKYYGGRGIKVEFASFEDFLAHVGERPPGTTIDRIDNDGNYAPGNVRWTTRAVQRRNQRPRKAE